MQNFVLAYALNDSLPVFCREDLEILTHVNLAFGEIQDGRVDMGQLTRIGLVRQFRAWNPEIKIVLSVGGWGAGGFSETAMTREGREAFAQSCLEAAERYGLDGIDIDWEYPGSNAAGIAADPRDRENFTLLLRALRDKLERGKYSLSFAVGAGREFAQGIETEKAAEIADYVQIMTYDMRGASTRQAGHHAALRAGKGDASGRNTAEVTELFLRAGVPEEKLVIGAAFYSRQWFGVEDRKNGLLQAAGTAGEAGPCYSDITEEFIRAGGYRKCWDEAAQAAYLWNGDSFISYESPEAIALKCRYVREKGLLGIMYWEHGCDKTHELVKVIGRELQRGKGN